ncbi:hypothetical protein [Clostridium transplantifaecale]|nr:hypothetical protein [Clostridium transplantifaecale]
MYRLCGAFAQTMAGRRLLLLPIMFDTSTSTRYNYLRKHEYYGICQLKG